MIEITPDNFAVQTVTNRLICQEALARGWRVRAPSLPSPHMFVDRGDGKELHLFSATPPTVTFAGAHLVDNKYATSAVLEDAGIEQLPFMLLDSQLSQFDESLQFIAQNGPMVVKPVDGGHGKGITVGVSSEDELRKAHRYAVENTRTVKAVVMQQQLLADDLHDVRVAVIAGRVVGAIERIPARVRGDGIHTVGELIEIENKQEYRGEPYRAKLAQIDSERAEEFLGESVHDVPADGEWRTVLAVANYGAGGELVDITDDLPQWMRDEAVEVARVLDLDVAGVDYLIDRQIQISTSRHQVKCALTEVNKCPALAIHDEPTVGHNRHATSAYLDLLAGL